MAGPVLGTVVRSVSGAMAGPVLGTVVRSVSGAMAGSVSGTVVRGTLAPDLLLAELLVSQVSPVKVSASRWSMGTVTFTWIFRPGGKNTGELPDGVHHGLVEPAKWLRCARSGRSGTPSGRRESLPSAVDARMVERSASGTDASSTGGSVSPGRAGRSLGASGASGVALRSTAGSRCVTFLHRIVVAVALRRYELSAWCELSGRDRLSVVAERSVPYRASVR